jgi:hypothetical protein
MYNPETVLVKKSASTAQGDRMTDGTPNALNFDKTDRLK